MKNVDHEIYDLQQLADTYPGPMHIYSMLTMGYTRIQSKRKEKEREQKREGERLVRARP
jgi:hypothetical protein